MNRLFQRPIILLTIGVCMLAIGIVGAAAQGLGNTEPAQPTPIPQTKITMMPGNATIGAEIETSIRQALAQARDANALPPVNYFAISAPPWAADKWLFASVVAFEKLDAKRGWRLDDASWFGLVLLHQDDDGNFTGAVEGTTEFSRLLAQVPDTILGATARQHLDPLQRRLMATTAYRFPWQSGTQMQYGPLGVHNAGYNPIWGTGSWKAVDFVSDGNTSAGHAPNRLFAAATGAIGGVCNDGTSVAIKIDNLIYAHLLNNNNLTTGHYFNQGDEMGQLRSGAFNASCGWAPGQPANQFHVHWGFPDTGSFEAGGWTLNLSDQLWRRGSETRGIYSWFQAEEVSSPCNPNANQIALFVDASYSGQCVVKGIGGYSNPGAIGLPNDSISSIKVGSNVKATLCEHDNYGGVCEIFTGNDGNLSDNSIGNDRVSSAKVETRNGGDGPSGYTFCANENERCNFSGTMDVAYGANGQFYYRSGVTGGIDCNNGTFGDPNYGVFKACYIKPAPDDPLAGYTFCSWENERCNFSGTKDVAYGANGQFYYRSGVTGGIDCNNGTFGDPIYGVFKACYIK
jgi:hypothetical protein